MTQQHLDLLSRIYNTLCLISTKGEDTVLMANCLQALNELNQQLTTASQMTANMLVEQDKGE